jgi:hypothetical protein
VALLIVAGCSERSAEELESMSGPPEVLGMFQGEWKSIATEESSDKCLVRINGDSLQIRYMDASGKVILRQSVGIDQVDEQRSMFVLAGTTAAWPYSYNKTGSREQLKLKYYSRLNEQWETLLLQRPEG